MNKSENRVFLYFSHLLIIIWRIIISMSMDALHIFSNKLSAVCAAVQAAGLRSCQPHGGLVRAVSNKPCHWSCSKAAGAAFLSEKVHAQSARNLAAKSPEVVLVLVFFCCSSICR